MSKIQNAPLISICIPTFRREELLLQTVQSILAQTMLDFEIIITDNDPAGSAEAVVQKLNDQRIRYQRNSENVGAVKNINIALAMAHGEFVVILSDDDPIYPDMLAILKKLSEDYPSYGAYYGACNVRPIAEDVAWCYGVNHGDNLILNPKLAEGEEITFSVEQYLSAYFKYQIFPYLFWSTGMVRREVIRDIGYFPDYGSGFFTDFAYLILVGSHSGLVAVNKIVGTQTIHAGNFGRDEYGELGQAIQSFYEYISTRLSHRNDWPNIRPKFEKFLGGWVTGYLMFIRKYLRLHHKSTKNLNSALTTIFQPPYMRIHFFKYLILAYVPQLFTVYRFMRRLVTDSK